MYCVLVLVFGGLVSTGGYFGKKIFLVGKSGRLCHFSLTKVYTKKRYSYCFLHILRSILGCSGASFREISCLRVFLGYARASMSKV